MKVYEDVGILFTRSCLRPEDIWQLLPKPLDLHEYVSREACPRGIFYTIFSKHKEILPS